MNKYEDEIRKSKTFKQAQEIARVENRKPITIQVTTEEGWIYWVTEDEVANKGTTIEMGIYVSQNRNDLKLL